MQKNKRFVAYKNELLTVYFCTVYVLEWYFRISFVGLNFEICATKCSFTKLWMGSISLMNILRLATIDNFQSPFCYLNTILQSWKSHVCNILTKLHSTWHYANHLSCIYNFRRMNVKYCHRRPQNKIAPLKQTLAKNTYSKVLHVLLLTVQLMLNFLRKTYKLGFSIVSFHFYRFATSPMFTTPHFSIYFI